MLHWTSLDIPHLSGKTAIVTGANSGLGYEAVKALAEKGAKVILACRSVEKGENARTEMLAINADAEIVVMELDLTDLQSIHQFAAKFKETNQRLDILINNAGIMTTPYRLTKDGFESQMGTNHLGHFALTGLLIDVLKQTAHSRVVTVSSMAHKQGVMDFTNLLYDKGLGYTPMKAYSRSKLANLLFTLRLQQYFEENKIDCMAIAAHPGVSETNLFSHLAPKWLLSLFVPLFRLMMQPANMGALPELRAATDPSVKGGEYYGPDGFKEFKGYPVIVQPNMQATNSGDAQKLWDLSEKLTGVKY